MDDSLQYEISINCHFYCYYYQHCDAMLVSFSSETKTSVEENRVTVGNFQTLKCCDLVLVSVSSETKVSINKPSYIWEFPNPLAL